MNASGSGSPRNVPNASRMVRSASSKSSSRSGRTATPSRPSADRVYESAGMSDFSLRVRLGAPGAPGDHMGGLRAVPPAAGVAPHPVAVDGEHPELPED